MITAIKVTKETSQPIAQGFADAYREAFAGPPYFEKYTRDEVIETVWTPHLNDGLTVVAMDGDLVVGFGCAVPIDKAPQDARDHLTANKDKAAVDLNSCWYMSELGVIESHRLQGIGYLLVKKRLEEIRRLGADNYAFRTAAEGSNSVHLYKGIGARTLGDPQDVRSSSQVQDNGSMSTERIFLYGSCSDAIARIPNLAISEQ